MNNTNFENIFEKEIENINININFYRKLICDLNKNKKMKEIDDSLDITNKCNKEFNKLSLDKMLKYELGDQDFSTPSDYLEEIQEKLDIELSKFNEINSLRTNIYGMFNDINALLNNKSTNMKEVINSFCELNNLDASDFNNRLNVKKIESIKNALWVRDFKDNIDEVKEKQRNNSANAHKKETFLKALKDVEETSLTKKDAIMDFRYKKQIPNYRTEKQVIDYSNSKTRLMDIYMELDNTDDILTKEECNKLRENSIDIYLIETKEHFSTVLDKYIPALPVQKQEDVKKLKKL